ncbi:hypothetical protein G9C85_06695 [Halorubellus sp. JP-L1]|uniref:hypothetical protein n=1 Tax=Halorubellus sp. JP-L1 TaxID=2715753 RepID=UPI00140B1E48|nr:hypothetical protein [Halorubellus sp. JP-L1]NHN41324.1 hypothetical protein [Halorubellus sp. JP-L1]
MNTTDVDDADPNRTVAKIYYDDDQPVQVDAAFIIEDWPWVVGFDQVGTDGHDYVSIPSERVVGVMSPLYSQFSRNGRRVTAYGIETDEIEEYVSLLPL